MTRLSDALRAGRDSKITRNASWLLAGELFGLASQLVMFILVTNTFDKSIYGTFVGVVSLALFVGPFSSFGAGYLVVQRVVGRGEALGPAVLRSWTTVIGGAALAGGAARGAARRGVAPDHRQAARRSRVGRAVVQPAGASQSIHRPSHRQAMAHPRDDGDFGSHAGRLRRVVPEGTSQPDHRGVGRLLRAQRRHRCDHGHCDHLGHGRRRDSRQVSVTDRSRRRSHLLGQRQLGHAQGRRRTNGCCCA